MKKRSLILCVTGIFLFLTDAFAQQDPQFSQYMFNMNVVNPAYAGSRGTLSLNLMARKQWTDVEGSPKTITFNGNAPVVRNVGMGLSLVADEHGPAKEQNIFADFAYTIKTSDAGRLAFGLKAGLSLLDVNLVDIVLPQTDDDDFFKENINEAMPNIGAGIFYYSDRFYAGFSVPNILESEHIDRNNINSKASEKAHFYLTSGYVFQLSYALKFKPSVLLKAVIGAPVSVDLNANFLYNERLELGASYRVDDSLNALINFGVTPAFRIGYAYDYTISDYSRSKPGGSHEILLLYDIDFTKKNLKSPRFF